MSFQGIYTALITPFRNNQVDVDALEMLVINQVNAGIHGLVACGTTAETPTLTDDEFELVASTVIKTAGGQVPVLVGTGQNDTDKTIARTKLAEQLGADGALVVTPYYNKPQQEGLFLHFKEIAEACQLPMMLYNVPGRTGVCMTAQTTCRLARVPRIVAVKEASGSLSAIRDIVSGTFNEFDVLSGDDGMALGSWALGSCGVVSVASNVACRPMVQMWEAWKAGKVKEAAEIDRRLGPLYTALFVETSPAPVKFAAELLGICSREVRKPLVSASSQTQELIRTALVHAKLL